MKKTVLSILLAGLCTVCMADVTVKPNSEKGGIKLMNAVNNGPVLTKGDQVRDNYQAFKDLQIPFARTHDAAFCSSYGGEHTVDISAIFPDFSKDVDDPASYDFTMTDYYLWTIREAGTDIFFRLGQKIEHNLKKYNIMPPADYAKWAKVCEHIIRHYNEGWADGYHADIQYWEIWNEPDLDYENDAWKVNPRTWGGSAEEFFEFYKVVANHLNKCFPDLKIGGPALCWHEGWAKMFLEYMHKHKVDIDFFSWHIYINIPEEIAAKAVRIRKLLDETGYANAESILNEWNYVRDWTDQYQYSVDVMNSLKGAAFVASTFQLCQDSPLDMLMYYDVRPGVFDGLFDYYTYAPREPYYVFHAWNKLLKLGKQLEVNVDEKNLYATAATDSNGKTAILVTRYNEDNNVVAKKKIKLNVSGIKFDEIVAHFTDSSRMYTEVPVYCNDGVIELNMEPNSFVMVELR